MIYFDVIRLFRCESIISIAVFGEFNKVLLDAEMIPVGDAYRAGLFDNDVYLGDGGDFVVAMAKVETEVDRVADGVFCCDFHFN